MVRRVFVGKRDGFDIEGDKLLADLRDNLGLAGLTAVRVFQRYDVEGIGEETYQKACRQVFSEPMSDRVYHEHMPPAAGPFFAMEYLPGQYDQRADSAAQCIQLITGEERPILRVAKIIVLEGVIGEEAAEQAAAYLINPVDSRMASLDKPGSLDEQWAMPADIEVIEGFRALDQAGIERLHRELGLAMSCEDLSFVARYFDREQRRDATMTEIRVIDTYWSDHCRHTTFLTQLDQVRFPDDPSAAPIARAWERYTALREELGRQDKPISLMDIATMGARALKAQGKLSALDESEEINACSIVVPVEINGRQEEYLVMFKNETHNHPTEVEPFGGAATCLGGAIRDPLSGRSYVYQAMRVTGSADPRQKVSQTLPGKLPQRKITTGAAAGYSSYGNQIGLATGQVREVYHPGYCAKRMEIGAVIGAVSRGQVVRERPEAGDVIVLLGGRTGRDGCGGATGSSKAHDEKSILTCGAEVQKGNPITERKIQRLFRDPHVSRMIKRCNDFGAGGVCVAIGELADGLVIDLDCVPKKYEGLDGTELAISESQERMAVVLDKENLAGFIAAANKENLEAVQVAQVTANGRLVMRWRGREIVNLGRTFLDTNGMTQHAKANVATPMPPKAAADARPAAQRLMERLSQLNVCSQKGLGEWFDASIGAGTVLMPFGGRYQLTPINAMVALIPVLEGETGTATAMSFGFDPSLSEQSPFHGAYWAVVEAVAKLAATGANWRRAYLTLQEYFEKLGKDEDKWGKPLASLLGALCAQIDMGLAAIGGKDSMSGTFEQLHVPPTLVAFGVCPMKAKDALSPEFKQVGSALAWLPLQPNAEGLPDIGQLCASYDRIYAMAREGKLLAAYMPGAEGLAAGVAKMAFGNGIGAVLCAEDIDWFAPAYGSLILEIRPEEMRALEGIGAVELGRTVEEDELRIGGERMPLVALCQAWQDPLEGVFPVHKASASLLDADQPMSEAPRLLRRNASPIARPRVFIPAFPGTNCEVDSQRAFERAGADCEVLVVRNLSSLDIEQTVEAFAKGVEKAQIIMLPGGFSAGDEPDGSGKFITALLSNTRIRDAVMELLQERDGLMLGICNGFQALVKSGLLPYGRIRQMDERCPTLTFNAIGRHVSRMVRTRVTAVRSPWLSLCGLGEEHVVPVSHGEGRFVASREALERLFSAGQVATQYVDMNHTPSMDILHNPNGAMCAIEGITSPDGRILGKMAHNERTGLLLMRNVPGNKDQRIFEAGVRYFQ